jgi:hypothetical protein
VEGVRFTRTDLFRQVGGFDISIDAMEDWDLTTRIARGERLPRAASYIIHDEGQLRLRTALAKKRYYAASAAYYLKKHGGGAILRGNIILRPAFFRHWRRLVHHPILTSGMLCLKGLEASAIAIGIVEAWARPKGRPDPMPHGRFDV